MPEWDKSWNDYMHHMLFAVDSAQSGKILGTFFSKGVFTFKNDNTITGSHIIWLPTQNENEYNFDNVNKLPNNIKYLFHRDLTGNIKKIYEVNNITYTDSEINVEYKLFSDESPAPSSSVEVTAKPLKPIIEDNELREEIKKNSKKVINAYNEVKSKNFFNFKNNGGSHTKGGNIINDMKSLLDFFEMFVNSFITHPVILKLNSLKTDQYKNLFSKDIFMLEKVKVVDSQEIGKIITNMLFHKFEINKNDNPVINDNVNKEFEQVEIIKNEDDSNNSNKNIVENGKIHIKELITKFLIIESIIKEKLKNPIQNTFHINDVFLNISKNINKIIEKFDTIIKVNVENNENNETYEYVIMDIINNLNSNNTEFNETLNKFIENNVSDKILTYVKINNFDHLNIKWNNRFNILLNNSGKTDNKFNSMIVDYYNRDDKYNFDKPSGFYFNNSKNEYNYTHRYLFGNFTKIFPPHMTNPEIAKQMTQIVKKVKDGKPVFIMGYGASGSGKTSSLIYFDKGNEGEKEGIIIDICKKICENDDDEGLFYDTIELTTQELFAKDTAENDENDENNETKKNFDDKCKNGNENFNNCVSKKYTFNFDGKSIITTNDNTNHDIFHEYRSINYPKNQEFGMILEYLIDKDRLVKATTNNPQSSRSHSLAFIKFIHSENKNNPGYLIVGDFAGVENEFECKKVGTITDFLNITNTDNELLYGGDFTIEKYKNSIRDIILNYIKYINNNNNNNEIKNKFYELINKNIDKAHILNYNDNIDTDRSGNHTIKDKLIHLDVIDFMKNLTEPSNNTTTSNKFKEWFNKTGLKKTYDELQLEYNKKIYESVQQKKRQQPQQQPQQQPEQQQQQQQQQQPEQQQQQQQQQQQSKEEYKKIRVKIDNKYIINELERIYNESNISIKIKTSKNIFDNWMKTILGERYHKNNNNNNNNDNKNYFWNNEDDDVDDDDADADYNDDDSNNDLNQEITWDYLNDNDDDDEHFDDLLFDLDAAITKCNNEKTNTIKDIKNKITILEEEYIPFYHQKKESLLGFEKYYATRRYIITFKSHMLKCAEYFQNYRFSRDVINEYKFTNNTNFTHTKLANEYISDDYFKKYCKELDEKQLKDIEFDFFKFLKDLFDSKFNETNEYIEKRSEILGNHPFYNEYIKKNNLNMDNKNEQAQNIFDIENEILTNVATVLGNIKKRLEKGKLVCDNRSIEGKFINKSLQDMREDIKNIFYEKQKGVIYISPDYINECLEKYCPTHSDCFKLKPNENSEIKSDIFKTIFNFIKIEKDNQNDQNNEYTIENFYKEILISVFCVFNISRDANNPPPVLYIDINKIKIGFKQLKEFKIIDKLQLMSGEWKLNKQEDKYSNNLDYYKNILNEITHHFTILIKNFYDNFGDMAEPTPYGILDNDDNDVDNVLILKQPLNFSLSNTRRYIVYGLQNMEVQLKEIKDYVFNENNKTYQLETHNALKTLISSLKNFNKYLVQLIEYYDNQNAISAIGTLEFLDQISKYNTTETICFLEHLAPKPYNYFEIYKNGQYEVKVE